MRHGSAIQTSGTPRTLALAFLLVLIGFLIAPAQSDAHARFESASIDPGAILASVPGSITLTFTEAVDPAFSSASLITPDQTVVSPVTIVAKGDDDTSVDFVIEEAASLPAGSYALLWRVVSSVDGHTTTGVLAFSAGTGTAPALASTSEAGGGNWSGTVGRWLELVALMVIAGAALLASVAGDPARSSHAIVTMAVTVALAGLIVTALNLLASATGERFGSWPGFSNAADIVSGSTPGRAWLIRLGLLIAIALLLLIPTWRRWRSVVVALLAGTALATFSFVGHAAGLRGNTAIVIDLVHILAGAAWGGGLILVAATIWRHRREDRGETGQLVSTYSRLALVAFLVVGISGVVSAWFNVAGPKNLTGSDYGLALILKVVLSLLIVTTASVNRFMIVPKLTSDSNELWKSLRLSALVELGLAFVVLIAAARLASIPPADEPLTVDVASRAGFVQIAGDSGDLTIAFEGELSNDPDGVFRVIVTDTATGAPASEIARVIIDARAPDPLDPAAEPIQDRFDASPIEGTAASYEIPRTRLGLEAIWSVEVIVRRLGVEDATLAFDLDLDATAPQPPRLVDEVWRLPRIPWSGYLALAAAAATVTGSLLLIRRLKGLEPVTAGIMLAVAGIITIGFLLSAWRSGPIPVSGETLAAPPGLDDPGAITRAADSWAMMCASCHGVDGGGTGDDTDDDAATHAHPSVAGDLLGPQSQARTPGELYWIITNGLGGTTMPAFDLALTDEQRADLVAYLIYLQSQAP